MSFPDLMPVTDPPVDTCILCRTRIALGEGRYRRRDGTVCVECGEKDSPDDAD